MRYLLGVDGGNTKTDYLLCTEDGAFVDVYRCGTCSHEQMRDGYDGMERVMREQLQVILSRNHISLADIAAAGFGLAGADLPSQVKELKKRVEVIGFSCFNVSNDGILGIKAMSESGAGLCVVNGTGTVVIGIDTEGNVLQVGGVGDISGDQAGGGHIMRDVMYNLYAYYFRCGKPSAMYEPLMALLKTTPDELMMTISDWALMRNNMKPIIQLADKAALSGDETAMNIFDTVGMTMGHSAAGCIRLLHFGEYGLTNNPLPIVLVGSIWHKIGYPGMIASFEETVKKLSHKCCLLIPLKAPPAVGGVLWAKEMLSKGSRMPVPSAYRHGLLESLTLERYEKLVKEA